MFQERKRRSSAALAKALTGWKQTEKLALGVYFDQQKDALVKAVNNLFGKHFDNKIVSVVYEQKGSLAVDAEFAAKLNLADIFGQDRQLYPYRGARLRVDKNGYAHFTAPLGGSVIIGDKPLTKKEA